jgi:hypothetical protein
MQHPPLDQLILEDDKIFEARPGGEKGNSYMDVPPISVVKALTVRVAGNNEFEFSFEISHSTCPVWRDIFSRHLPEFEVKFQGDKMLFQCIQPNLESRYERIKAAIAATNTTYASQRSRLIESIKADQAQKTAETQRKADALQTAQESLNKLKL